MMLRGRKLATAALAGLDRPGGRAVTDALRDQMPDGWPG
jgi:hypothetical protein